MISDGCWTDNCGRKACGEVNLLDIRRSFTHFNPAMQLAHLHALTLFGKVAGSEQGASSEADFEYIITQHTDTSSLPASLSKSVSLVAYLDLA